MLYLLLFLLLLLLDQGSKIWAVRALSGGPMILWENIFELRYLENRGAAFGLLQNGRIFFLIITAAVLLALMYLWRKTPKERAYSSLRMLIILLAAGAVGNLIDRIWLGYVRDFFYFSLIDFPIFNVADICVVLSVAFFLIFSFFRWPEDFFAFLKRSVKEK